MYVLLFCLHHFDQTTELPLPVAAAVLVPPAVTLPGEQLMPVIKFPLVHLFAIHVWCTNLLLMSQGFSLFKLRLNQISSHVYMIRPYQIVNYPQQERADESKGQ